MTRELDQYFLSIRSCPTLCNPTDFSVPGFPGHQQFLELAQTHVHWVDDAIQPSHPLSFPSPAFNLSQHQSFLMSRLFAWSFHSIWASASASVLPMNIQGWFPLGLTGLIFLLSKRFSRVFSSTTVQTILWHSAFFTVQLSHPYMTTGKIIALTVQTFSAKWYLCFLICCLGWSQLFFQEATVLISWLQSPSEVILEPPKYKVCHCFHFFPICVPLSDGTGCHDLSLLNVEF